MRADRTRYCERPRARLSQSEKRKRRPCGPPLLRAVLVARPLRTILARLRFVDLHVAAADRLPVERLNRFRSSAGVRHLDEAESLGLARELIRNDRGRRHFAECGERLVTKDSVINSENRDLARRIMALGADEQTREAGLHAIIISRCLERIGDNAVDIGERVAYLVSGEFREFTDASHAGE